MSQTEERYRELEIDWCKLHSKDDILCANRSQRSSESDLRADNEIFCVCVWGGHTCLELFGRSKVAQFAVAARVDENVFAFDIAVDDTVRVTEGEGAARK